VKLKFLSFGFFLVAAVFAGAVCQNSYALQDTEEKAAKEQDEKESLQERLTAVQRLIQNGEEEDALDLLKEIYEDGQQDNVNVAANLVALMQQIGLQKAQEDRKSGSELFYDSAKIAREILKDKDLPEQIKSRMASVIYNEACTYALDGNKDKALAGLKESFELGFDDFELASTDTDFGDLLKEDEFKKIIEGGKEFQAKKKIDDLNKAIAEFKPFKFDYELEDVDGKPLKKSDSKGKMLIVDLWGTWCPPCRREVPSFVKLKKKYGDKLDIVGLADERTDDDDEALEKVTDFMKEYDVNYPCALLTSKVKRQVPRLRGFPTTLFIDGSGTVRIQLVGFRTYEDLEMTLKAVMELEATDESDGK
jgi:thiol-disulfide isomerase/thioredoxin